MKPNPLARRRLLRGQLATGQLVYGRRDSHLLEDARGKIIAEALSMISAPEQPEVFRQTVTVEAALLNRVLVTLVGEPGPFYAPRKGVEEYWKYARRRPLPPTKQLSVALSPELIRDKITGNYVLAASLAGPEVHCVPGGLGSMPGDSEFWKGHAIAFGYGFGIRIPEIKNHCPWPKSLGA